MIKVIKMFMLRNRKIHSQVKWKA